MKLLVLLLLMLAVVWLWRRGHRMAPPGAARPRLGPPQPMLPCALCGTHVPAGDAVAGRPGSYCCARHRREAEDA